MQESQAPDNNYTGGGSGGSGGGSGRGGRIFTSESNTPGNWNHDEKGWKFNHKDGSPVANEWYQLVWNNVTSWYYFNAEGYMVTGWFEYEGNRYYLHPHSDGTQGFMYVGWHEIEGKWYYFNDISDGTKGRLLTNTTTPDGYQVGADGAWVQ